MSEAELKVKPARKAAKKRAPAVKKVHKTSMPANFVARLAEGETYTSIAADLGLSTRAVTNWAEKPEVQQKLADLQREASAAALRRLTSLQPKAVSAVSDVLVAPKACKVCGRGPGKRSSDKDRLKAVELVLDRTGMPKTERQELAGSLGLVDDTTADRDILTEAARILQARGLTDLADQVRLQA